ncbi:hypothetical protein J558_3203 [Acinetobacter baumannii 1106579]|uniref:Uncharacterized protein n=1 Tax=Acinetobacter haemolyticus ATCC 19194 TaxID=707232 RepID=D4XKF7_ACIHA|nr:hypothetical protein HMP0015_0199 [Acinetobacter haemolyticus ATCC 19194]EXE16702.1 hypothetical protein J558_3203 [Acinetobacter baumannii 1106579]EXE71623.1 hypothetical protein J583_3511 [Acinetobacter baumannii 83444]
MEMPSSLAVFRYIALNGFYCFDGFSFKFCRIRLVFLAHGKLLMSMYGLPS